MSRRESVAVAVIVNDTGALLSPAEPSIEAAQPESVRERNFRQTRERIHLTALSLAERDGVGNLTVAQIAEGASVSRRTFFRYFSNKEEAVLAGQRQYLEAVTRQPLDATTVAEALGAIERLGDTLLASESEAGVAVHRRVHAVISTDPVIRAYAAVQDQVIAEVLRDRLIAQLPAEDPLALELAASLAVTTWRHGWVRWSAQVSAQTPETLIESHRAVRAQLRTLVGSVTPVV